MIILKEFILLVLGFVFLIKGADFFVDGSSSVAKRLKVPSLIIGLTIVAMGTSLPEAAVSVSASITNNNALAVSNVVGSNIFNLLVVCGMCTLFMPLTVSKQTLKKEFPLSILCAILLLIFGFRNMCLGRFGGLALVAVFIVFIWKMISSAKKARAVHVESKEESNTEILSIWRCILYIIGGVIAVIFGGNWVVDSASKIATFFGMSQTLIGLTIVAVGTSLPELATSVIATKKNELDMALGNAIGSNIFNILMILGVAATISPIEFITENVIDIVILIIFSTIVLIMAWKEKKLKRSHGIIMIGLYLIYTVYICIR